MSGFVVEGGKADFCDCWGGKEDFFSFFNKIRQLFGFLNSTPGHNPRTLSP